MPLSERDANIPHKSRIQTPPARKAPTPLSKLPRRVATPPNTAPAATQWTARVADRIASAERSAMEGRPPSASKAECVTSRSYPKKPVPPPKDKPLPGEKPLPSRPIARLSNALSPSKDGRCLIDASEKPLRVRSIIGKKEEWPTLEPQRSRSSSVTPTQEPEKPEQAASGLKLSTTSTDRTPEIPASAELIEEELTSAVEEEAPMNSRSSSYVSAVDTTSDIQTDAESKPDADKAGHSTEDIITAGQTRPPSEMDMRHASLRRRISSGSLVSPSLRSKQNFMGFTDFTRDQIPSNGAADSRPHSPSPASFSRPRPGSISSSSFTSRATKTASRIPILDPKKATVVDVKKNRQSGYSIPKSGVVPTFGSRRLASPDALKILENGKMRRQLQRTPTGGSNACSQLHRTISRDSIGTDGSSGEAPSLSHSLDSSPNPTLGPSSPVNDTMNSFPSELGREATESNFEATVREDRELQERAKQAFGSGWTRKSEVHDFEDENRFLRSPPQTSPHTAPLPTIPSQAILPLDALVEKPETELTRTLSHLEGKGSPPKTEIDDSVLMQMFGHLKRGFERTTPNSAAFVQNAAAAEKFLAMSENGTSVSHQISDEEADASRRQPSVVDVTDNSVDDANPESKLDPAISKWSESTPSDKGMSPLADGLSASQDTASSRFPQRRSSLKAMSNGSVSIGYPSCIPARTTAESDDAASVASIARRKSSPTLGKALKPGSVRVARQGISVTAATFARPTASAESKKVARMPTPNTKAFTLPDTSHRGRVPSTDGRQSKLNGSMIPKTPRSRSKSRLVLDKINGLFSGKREKKSVAIPPVPRIEENSTKTKDVEVTADGSPKLRSTKPPQLPKMPSLSPSSHVTLRPLSRATAGTDDTTLIDGFTVQDESQSVQVLSEHLIGKAQRENDPRRKERMLSFAKVLNDSLISAREAQISAETAQHAAKSAQLYYEMTQKSLVMLQRLASSVGRGGTYSRH